jgi:hypothetical protein
LAAATIIVGECHDDGKARDFHTTRKTRGAVAQTVHISCVTGIDPHALRRPAATLGITIRGEHNRSESPLFPLVSESRIFTAYWKFSNALVGGMSVAVNVDNISTAVGGPAGVGCAGLGAEPVALGAVGVPLWPRTSHPFLKLRCASRRARDWPKGARHRIRRMQDSKYRRWCRVML